MSDEIDDLERMARELEARLTNRAGAPGRWNANPEDVRRSVMQLVLTLVELIRQLLERQALRRMDEGTLTPDEIERVGQALMQLEATVQELAEQNGLEMKDLNLDLGPLGKLL
jgi:uncharacterized protein YjiS (DUF1127 family)